MNSSKKFVVVVPAAGVGKRMKASCPKQYLEIDGTTILEHTVNRLLSCPSIGKVVIALGDKDEYFSDLAISKNPNVETVIGGKERVDSVLSGLNAIDSSMFDWVMVHDAARPCVTHEDIEKLISSCIKMSEGGLLAAPVKDTMKRSAHNGEVTQTVDRNQLWHALTPQMYKIDMLKTAIEQAQLSGREITDESSAIEAFGESSHIIPASSENIKITNPDDLALAEFILNKQHQLSKKAT